MRSPLGRRPLLPLLLALLALVGAARVEPARAEEPAPGAAYEDGAAAPAHGWTQEDGCPARTGASAARALRGPLERAWKAAAREGAFEGEPLAWKDRVFVVERAGKKRVLRVLAAGNGAERARLSVESAAPLGACVGEGRLLVRTSPTTVEGFAVGDAVLVKRWKVTAQEGIGAPTMLRDEVYLVRDGVLERWAYGGTAPLWPKPGAADAVRVERDVPADGAPPAPARFPRPSLRGASVFVATRGALVEVDRASGAERGRVAIEGLPDPDASRVVVGAADVFLRRGTAATPGASDVLWIARSSPGSMEVRAGLAMPGGVAAFGSAWLGVVEAEGKRRLVGRRGAALENEEPFLLAGDGLHEEFVGTTPPTPVAGAVYVGLRAFAVPSLDVLRASGPPVLARAVPLRDKVLVLEGPNALSAWRAVRPAGDAVLVRPPGAAPASATPVALKACRVALEDGRVLEGTFSWDPKAATFRSAKPGELPACPARTVHAVLTTAAPRRLLLASRADDAAEGVAAIVRAETARDALLLVKDAVAAGDASLARTVLGRAAELGALDADVAAADAAVAALEASPTPADDAKAKDVEARLAALAAREPDALVEVASNLPKEAPIEAPVALVRAAAERDPAHAGATAWVRARLPKEVPLPEPLRLDQWLDFVEVRSKLDVRVWGVDAQKNVWGTEGKVPAQDSPLFHAFWSARSAWPGEADVVAFECGPLVVFSPLDRPGSIVRCLALGRLVSETLDATFAPVGPPRADAESLILHLYSTRQQYLARSRPTGEAERSDGLENTAGHYSPSDNVTRMFFPDDEDDAESVPGVYTHELTHHWIERRRPNGKVDSDRSSDVAGYWVVEGIADFLMNHVWDVARRRATPENPRADYADAVSGVAPESLIPWPKLLTLTQAQFHELSIDDRVPLPRRFRLGPVGSTAPILLFYNQGAALCAWLYLAEGGKHRKALLDVVYAYYEGRAKADTLTTAVGLTPEEIGKRVVAWCRELVKKG